MNLKKNQLPSYSQQQYRRKWSEQENELLLNLTKIFGFVKSSWRLISVEMKDSGFDRSPKQCKDRYTFYLNKTNTNDELTESELRQLLEYTQQFGNKWSLIAQELGNRTSQSIKNKFYAHVKKILRRLFKLKLKQQLGSKRIQRIKEGTLSNIFCAQGHSDQQKQDNFDHYELMVNKFKQLIIDHHNIKKSDVLNEATKNEVNMVYNFLIKHVNDKSFFVTFSEKEQQDSCVNTYFNQISTTSQQIESEQDLEYYQILNYYSHKDESITESHPFFLN